MVSHRLPGLFVCRAALRAGAGVGPRGGARALGTDAAPPPAAAPKSHRVSSGTIGIVGCGGVGTASATSLIRRGRGTMHTLLLYDSDAERCRGEVLDLNELASFHGVQVRQALTVGALRGCDVLVIAAGAKCTPGEARSALVSRNAAMLHALAAEMLAGGVVSRHSVLLLATNPVDALTRLLAHWLSPHLPPQQIIGSGTYIDSQRLRVLLAKRLCVPPKLVHAFVLGEHGDSQVASYDMAIAGTGSLSQWGLGREEFAELAALTRRRAQEIVYRKGHTRHCVGQCVARICEAVVQDTHDVLPVSVAVPAFGATFGWPCVVGRTGAERVLPVEVGPRDEASLRASAAAINRVVDAVLLQYPAPLQKPDELTGS
jgi:L-lactate dehydrogenase